MLAIHAGSGCDHHEAAFLTSAHGNSQYIKGSGNPISSSTNPHFFGISTFITIYIYILKKTIYIYPTYMYITLYIYIYPHGLMVNPRQ